MQILDQIMYTGVATTDNARVGRVRSEDGNFDLPYIPPVPGPWEGQEGTNPEQLLAAAWSICFHGLLGAGLRERDADPDGSRVRVSIDLGQNGTGTLGLAAGIAVTAPAIDRDVLSAALEEAYKRCPFCQAMDGNIGVDLRIIE